MNKENYVNRPGPDAPRGWSRTVDTDRGLIFWRMWQDVGGGRVAFQLCVDMWRIRRMGRSHVAGELRKVRKGLRKALLRRLKEVEKC